MDIMTHTICPHCGYDLAASADIERDGFWLRNTGEAYYDGNFMHLTSQQGQLLYTVAKAGRPISARVIGERISDAEDSYNLVQVNMTRIRARLKADSIPCPIANVRGLGLVWQMP
jgi:DNA-binding response OmpR family regulator